MAETCNLLPSLWLTNPEIRLIPLILLVESAQCFSQFVQLTQLLAPGKNSIKIYNITVKPPLSCDYNGIMTNTTKQ